MSSMRQGEGDVTDSFGESVQMIVRTERFLIECENSSGDHGFFFFRVQAMFHLRKQIVVVVRFLDQS